MTYLILHGSVVTFVDSEVEIPLDRSPLMQSNAPTNKHSTSSGDDHLNRNAN